MLLTGAGLWLRWALIARARRISHLVDVPDVGCVPHADVIDVSMSRTSAITWKCWLEALSIFSVHLCM